VNQQDKALISMLMINEYAQYEENIRWYMGFLGDIATREPELWQWVNNEIRRDILGLNQGAGGVLGNPNPNLASDVTSVAKRWFARGLYFGTRREGVIYQPLVEATPLTDELKNLPPKKVGDEPFSEIENDFDDETFA